MKVVENKLMLEKIFNISFRKANVESREMLDRNVEIFKARYAYDMTFAEISKEFDLSVERVRQIVCKMERKLKVRVEKMS